VIGSVVIYLGCREEDKYLIKKFGDDYKDYMQKVPQMNFLLGIIRLSRRSN
jgi:protein-S-isoprenylcysteine O-methyltransferase Ste14